jgi:hypothetical protein
LSNVFGLVIYQKGLKIILIGFTALSILNLIFLQGPFEFNTYSTYTGGFLLILYALFYLHKLIQETPVEKIEALPMLWISFGILTYFGGTSILFLSNNFLIANRPRDHQTIWILHNFFNILKNVLFAIALWKDLKVKIY